jgi:hypothetical protein
VMALLIKGSWAALHEDAATHRATTEAAVALADADGRPFPRAVARTLAAASAAPYLGDPTYLHELAAEALALDSRFGYAWLSTVAEAVDAYATAMLSGRPTEGIETLEPMLEGIEAVGRRGNVAVWLIMLADLYSAAGRTSAARDALMRAREEPGPYGGLVVDFVDRKLSSLT